MLVSLDDSEASRRALEVGRPHCRRHTARHAWPQCCRVLEQQGWVSPF